MPTHRITLAGLLDDLMLRYNGSTWDDLLLACQEHSALHRLKTKCTLGQIRAHARFRSKTKGWRLEMDDKRCRLTREP